MDIFAGCVCNVNMLDHMVLKNDLVLYCVCSVDNKPNDIDENQINAKTYCVELFWVDIQ